MPNITLAIVKLDTVSASGQSTRRFASRSTCKTDCSLPFTRAFQAGVNDSFKIRSEADPDDARINPFRLIYDRTDTVLKIRYRPGTAKKR